MCCLSEVLSYFYRSKYQPVDKTSSHKHNEQVGQNDLRRSAEWDSFGLRVAKPD